jgi:hypothetical protein
MILLVHGFLKTAILLISNDKLIFSFQMEILQYHRLLVRNDYIVNLSGGYIQLLKGTSPLPIPKQNVTVSKWLNGEMHIYFSGQETNFIALDSKSGKKVIKSLNRQNIILLER